MGGFHLATSKIFAHDPSLCLSKGKCTTGLSSASPLSSVITTNIPLSKLAIDRIAMRSRKAVFAFMVWPATASSLTDDNHISWKSTQQQSYVEKALTNFSNKNWIIVVLKLQISQVLYGSINRHCGLSSCKHNSSLGNFYVLVRLDREKKASEK